MNNIFSPDSKLIAMLDLLANTILLNLLFVVCCLPVVTIGAAYTALFSGCRAIANGEACFRAFFRSFRSGFKRATLAWLILLPVLVLLALTSYTVWAYAQAGVTMGAFTMIVSLVGLVFMLAVAMMVFLFYSRFECTLRQLLKNGILMTMAYLLRAIIIGLLCWGPVLMFFLLAPYTFMQLSVVFLIIWFGVAANLSVRLMKKPFASLEQTIPGWEAPKAEEPAAEEEPEEEDASSRNALT